MELLDLFIQKMGIVFYFAFPLVILITLFACLFMLGFGFLMVLGCGVVFNIIYLFYVLHSHRHFKIFTADEIELPPFTFHYKEQQGNYYDIELEFIQSLLPSEIATLSRESGIKIMSMHFDYPSQNADQNICRCAIGFFSTEELSKEMMYCILRMQCRKAKNFETGCKALQTSWFPIVSELSFFFSTRVLRILGDKLKNNYAGITRTLDKDQIPLYLIVDYKKKSLAYGTMIGENRKQFAISTVQKEINVINSQKIK